MKTINMSMVANLTSHTLSEFMGLHQHTLLLPSLFVTLIILFFHLLFTTRSSNKVIYLLDFACYKPPAALERTREAIVDRARRCLGQLPEETLVFMKSAMERGGLGDSTCLPEGFFTDPLALSMAEAQSETEAVVFNVIDELLIKTGVRSEDIGILVVNCCIFRVMPSICSMIVNRYKLRDGVLHYNLSGMGCSAGLRALGLAKQLLQVHQNSYALVVSTENITQNLYKGNDRSKILINCLFRVGGAAILLSNRISDRLSSKYQLIHSIHSHVASSGSSYKCIIQEEDQGGHVGVTITKDLLVVAAKAIEHNITTLAPLILPIDEQIRYVLTYVLQCIHLKNIEPYVPNFRKSFDHFLPHVGGKPVLEELQKNLGLKKDDMEASEMTLYRFGNTSSSSVWYELAYVEAKGRIKKGDRVWQIAFGSGFKCSSVVLRAMRTVDRGEKNPWRDEIDKFPINYERTQLDPYYFEKSKTTSLN